VKTTEQGRQAETAVAELLVKHGFEILDKNWRQPRCEIDLVATKDKTVYFVEVKYRVSNLQGEGFNHITSKKEAQMRFAAEVWIQDHGYNGANCEHIKLLEL
jgi:ribonuclease HII